MSAATVAVLAVPVAASAGTFTQSASTFSPLTAFAAAGVAERPAYPQQNVLPVWPDNPADGSAAIGDIPYDEIAPKLNALQAASTRVSARVAGRSSGGRDLYAVVVTAPETAAEAAQQGAWRQLLEDDPVRARSDPELLANYKTPLFVNGNIHGNEKEGTDAIVRVIEQWATSTDPADRDAAQAQHHRLQRHVEPGRADRQHARQHRGLRPQPRPDDRLPAGGPADPRPDRRAPADHHARPARLRQPDAAAPEHAAAQRQQRVRPLHQARRCRTRSTSRPGIAALGYPEVTRARIPFRDDAPGVWDDFPPIYVPSFAMLQSSIPYTIEAPLQPSGTGATAIRRADIDTDVHDVAIKTSLKYIQDHRNEVIFDQAEGYRRGWAGEPLRDIPDGYVPGWGPEDKYNTTFPRAYVIPAGARQHSAPAAKRVVDLLIASGGRVTVAKAAFTAGGNSYPAGSYILDLHQPKRGLVNSLLEPGIDLTDRVDDLYAGPGGWSQALTWGATVDTLWDAAPTVETERVFSGVSVGQLPAGDRRPAAGPAGR